MRILTGKGDTNTGFRGTNKRALDNILMPICCNANGDLLVLKREDPKRFLKLQQSLVDLMEKGLPAEAFWDSFIQCMDCKYVMPRHYFPYYHTCVVQVIHSHLGLEVPELPDFLLSSDFNESKLPGPASSDDTLGPDALMRAVLAHRQANPVQPVTPGSLPSE